MTDTSKENIHEAALIIANELLMDEEESDKIVHFNEYEAVKQFLADRIKYLLEYEPEKMKNILYRIDVSEQRVLEALANNPIHQAVLIIADLILQREIQKTITRKQYSSQAIDPDLAL
jgi:hypothetical protein